MFGGTFGSSFGAGQKSVLPPPNVAPSQQNLQINLPALMQALGDHEAVANAFSMAFAQMQAQLQNYPPQHGQPIASGAQQLLQRMQRESYDLEKAGQIGAVLIEQVDKLRYKQASIDAQINELRRTQVCLSILQLDKISQADYTRITNQLMEIRPESCSIEAFKEYVRSQAIEVAKLLK